MAEKRFFPSQAVTFAAGTGITSLNAREAKEEIMNQGEEHENH
jgi:hypothetical protein